jgi:eukaryotic-like serine/threonine-protein kinase
MNRRRATYTVPLPPGASKKSNVPKGNRGVGRLTAHQRREPSVEAIEVVTVESLSGFRIGPYRVRREIGRGGMGIIYEAYDETLHREVALKVMRPAVSGEGLPEQERRFLREARALAKVVHPNVTPIYSYGVERGMRYIACQIVRGETLSERLARTGPFGVVEALRIARSVASALDAIHRIGLVHRDIKTSNVMLDESGKATVVDFGLARETAADARITRSDLYVGTPEYCAPEQLRGEDVDGRADVYSLGVVLYEMLTGRPPHDSKSTRVLSRQILLHRAPPLRRRRRDVPKSVERLVDRMLSKDPAKRTESAMEAIRSIDAIADPAGAAHAARSTGILRRLVHSIRRRLPNRRKREFSLTLGVGTAEKVYSARVPESGGNQREG